MSRIQSHPHFIRIYYTWVYKKKSDVSPTIFASQRKLHCRDYDRKVLATVHRTWRNENWRNFRSSLLCELSRRLSEHSLVYLCPARSFVAEYLSKLARANSWYRTVAVGISPQPGVFTLFSRFHFRMVAPKMATI